MRATSTNPPPDNNLLLPAICIYDLAYDPFYLAYYRLLSPFTLSRMSATSDDASQATDTSGTPTAITTVVYSTVSNSIVQVFTVTSYSGAPVPSGGVWQKTKQSIPVAPIAGGAAGGVLLALAVVIAWVWWGKCIKRKSMKEKKEAVRRSLGCDYGCFRRSP